MEYPLHHLTDGALSACVTRQWTNGDGVWYETFRCPECHTMLVARSNMRDGTPLRDRLDQHLLTYCAARVAQGRRHWDNVTTLSQFTMMRLFPRWGARCVRELHAARRQIGERYSGNPIGIIYTWAQEAEWMNERFLTFCDQMQWYARSVKHVVNGAESRQYIRTPAPKAGKKPRAWHHPAFRVAIALRSYGVRDVYDL